MKIMKNVRSGLFLIAPFIERYNRTLQGIISKYMTQNQTYTFYNRLQDFIDGYNKRKHRSISVSYVQICKICL